MYINLLNKRIPITRDAFGKPSPHICPVCEREPVVVPVLLVSDYMTATTETCLSCSTLDGDYIFNKVNNLEGTGE